MAESPDEDPELAALPDHQWQALQLHLEGNSPPEIARQLGYSRQSVHKWTKKPVFRRYVQESRAQSAEATKNVFVSGVAKAAETIRRFAAGEMDAPPNVQLRAAEIVVERSGFGQAPGQHEQPATDEEIHRRVAGFYGQPEPEPETESEEESEVADTPKVRVADDDDEGGG